MKNLLVALSVFFNAAILFSADISGIVTEEGSGEYLTSATVALYSDTAKTAVRGTYTNKFGFYSIPKVEPGKYFIKFSFLGKRSEIKQVEVDEEDLFIKVELSESGLLTDEIEVIAEREKNSTSTISTVEISPDLINDMPALFGEKDVFRVLQLLPGVHQGSEISSGIYVRGGTPDQNLYLLDGVTVYNPSHLGGFLSSFNSDALRSLKLIKGAFPAEYGGRLSSVLDMSMKEGHKEKVQGSAGISLISSRLTIDGPITDNSTFMVSGRAMYLNVLMQLMLSKEDREDAPKYHFYDFNLKTNLKISEKDRLFISGFFAKDILSSPEDEFDDGFDIGWQNTTGNLRWMHIVSSELFTNFSLIYTNYNFSTEFFNNRGLTEFFTESGIEDVTIKAEAEYFPHKSHRIKTGLEATYHRFKVNTIEGLFDSGVEFPFRKLNSTDISYYAQDEWSITPKLNSNIGFRVNYFTGGNYFNAEPRLSFKYALGDDNFLKSAFGIAHQPLHLIYRNEITLPTDSWMPVTDKIKPGVSYQGVLGYETMIFGEYLVSAEAYYKLMNNIYEYHDTVRIYTTTAIEDQLTGGSSDSWGIELFVEKKIGNLTGWIGYTYSKTLRYFDELNDGKAFHPRHDRTHDLKIVATYEISPGWDLGANWVYGTGQAYTVPNGRYPRISSEWDFPWGYSEFHYTERNGFRMPAYHRLDVNFMRKFELFGKYPAEFSINIYNVYNRMNPFAIYLDQDWSDGDFENVWKLKQITLFPILPTFGFSFKF
jgi:hypothetical protein